MDICAGGGEAVLLLFEHGFLNVRAHVQAYGGLVDRPFLIGKPVGLFASRARTCSL